MAVKSLEQQLAQLSLKKVKFSNGKTLAQVMKDEANRLADCIQYYIDEYYRSYKPVIYDRTGGYQHSLYVENIADIRVVGNTIRISIGFDLNRAMHDNLSGVYHNNYGIEYWLDIKDRHKTFVPRMMEMGWVSNRLASMLGHHVYRLTYFEGIGAVERGINDFNRNNPYGIKIDADDFYNGRAY